MRKIKSILSVFLFVLNFNCSSAEIYYVSNSGDDRNDGLSPVYPIKSLEKVNAVIFKLNPGDAVLFDRGSVFNGQININVSGNADNPITFGAYGSGRDPVISGSIPITNWNIHKGNIFKADVNFPVKNLFVNDDQMIVARYPNTGFLKIGVPFKDAKKGFTDNSMKQVFGYWKNSILRVRSENWAYEYSDVNVFKDGSFTFSNPTQYPLQAGWGYYLDNNLKELDAQREWYYESSENNKGTVYFYPPGNQLPGNISISGTVQDYGFFSIKDISNIVIQDLAISDQNIAGIYFSKSRSGVRLKNCTFNRQNQLGVYISNNSENTIINNCRFYGINGKAIYLLNTKNSVISENIFRNIGMVPGYGTTGDPFPMTAILIFGDNNHIYKNNIVNVGHDGINSIGLRNLIEKNYINNCLLLLNDGGGIKSYGEVSGYSKWQNNFIFNVKGNVENAAQSRLIALGIYLDELSNYMTINDNTISKSGLSGIGINDGFNNQITNNVLNDNPIGINFYLNNIRSKNNYIAKNYFFGFNEEHYSVEMQFHISNVIPARFDSNYYFTPENQKHFEIIRRNIATDLNFNDWKNLVKSDMNSIIIMNNDFAYSRLYTNMSNDPLSILLNPGINFKSYDLKNVYGSIVITPWSSKILFANSDISKLPVIN
ncbi:MAG: right-handed parallel beta-helix repeat-containing protein, partial [Ignavibacteria bacterium]